MKNKEEKLINRDNANTMSCDQQSWDIILVSFEHVYNFLIKIDDIAI